MKQNKINRKINKHQRLLWQINSLEKRSDRKETNQYKKKNPGGLKVENKKMKKGWKEKRDKNFMEIWQMSRE